MSATDQAGAVTTLVDGKLYALHNPYELNGYVSTHPAGVRGWAPLNCYLLLEGKRALLIDTGFSVHERSLVAQIAALLPDDATLSIFPALGEYAGCCNTRPLIERFNVDTVYGIIGSPAAWTDFRPEYAPYGGPVGHGSLERVGAGYVHADDRVKWSHEDRLLEAFRPPLRLLPSLWYYDSATKTLFTGDMFNHVWREDAHGPWVVNPAEPRPALSRVRELLTQTRYWWLPGARTAELLCDLRQVFEQREVAAIAPRFGCVLADRESIRVHLELLETILHESATAASTGVQAGAEPMGRDR